MASIYHVSRHITSMHEHKPNKKAHKTNKEKAQFFFKVTRIYNIYVQYNKYVPYASLRETHGLPSFLAFLAAERLLKKATY